MDSSLVRKMEKARNYAEQRERVTFLQFKALFRGDHGVHEVSYEVGSWQCTCNYFRGRATCSHVMAMGLVLKGMVSSDVASYKHAEG